MAWPKLGRRIVVAVALLCGCGGGPHVAGTTPSGKGALQSFAWLSGRWCSVENEEATEETWAVPYGNAMLGTSRTFHGETLVHREFIVLETVEGQTMYRAHPLGQSPASFRLAELGDGMARFENPEHDFPQWIEYVRDGTKLTATIGGASEDGSPQTVRFAFDRASCDRMDRP